MDRREKDFANYVVDLMQTMGPVTAKAMFGGHGLFLDGLMFGLIADSELYLKVDKENETTFIGLGLAPFSYGKGGKTVQMSYYQAPEAVLEDAEAMNKWANLAYAAALRTARKKR